MNLANILEKFFKGYTILEETESRFNGQIQVQEDLFGRRRLLVGGLTQSGRAVENIWQKAIQQFGNLTIGNCLILGLGAGNAAKIINKYFPKAKITGVEIDPEIILLGKKYFGLDKIKNLKIEMKNALTWVGICSDDSNHDNKKFDVILVDLFLGDYYPKEAENEKFLSEVKKLLKPKGYVIFNRLYYKENIIKADKFQKKLKMIFTNIEAKKADYNILFLCRNI